MSDMSAEPAEALDVLRAVWRSQGQTVADLDYEAGTTKTCKRMDEAGVGYSDFAAGDDDLSAAWRARLEREGKLDQSGSSVRDLVMGPAETR
jgi:hypothetical protein